MRSFYTYLHCKPDGTPFYVGKGCNGAGHSRRSHDFKQKRNRHYLNVVAKYGKENILVYVFPCESEKQAFDDEIQQIAGLRGDGHELTNKTNGGDGATGLRHSSEWIELTRQRMIGNKYAVGNLNNLGKKNALGWKPTDEQKRKMSAAATAREERFRAARLKQQENLYD